MTQSQCDTSGYDAIFRGCQTLAVTLSPDLTCHYASPNHQALTGFAPHQLRLAQWRRRIHPEDKRLLSRKLAQGETAIEFRLKHADSRWHWYQADVQTAQEEVDSIRLLMMQDITDYKKEQQQHQHVRRCRSMMQQSRSALLTHMNHELRTPLNAIIGFSEMLLSGMPVDRREYMEHIHSSGQTLMQSIDQLISLAKESLYDSLLMEAPHDIREILHEVKQQTVREVGQGLDTRLQLDVPSGAVWAFVDGRKFSLGLSLLMRFIAEEAQADEPLHIRCAMTGYGDFHLSLSLPEDVSMEHIAPLLKGDSDALLVSQKGKNAPLYLTLGAQLLALHEASLAAVTLSGNRRNSLMITLPASRVLPRKEFPPKSVSALAAPQKEEMA